MTIYDHTPGLPDPAAHPEFYDRVALKRLFAWMIDVVVIALLTVLAIPLTFFAGLFFLPVLYAVISFLYRWVTISRGSATLGMRILDIEFRDRHGEPFDISTAFLHTAGYAISVAAFPVQFVSAAFMLMTERSQGLTDLVLGTAAVNRAD